MKFLNLGCPQKLYKICEILSYSCFLCKCSMQYDIKPNTGSIPFSNRKYKKREELATKKKMKEKNTTSADINSH